MRIAGGNVETNFNETRSSPLSLSSVRRYKIDVSSADRNKGLQLAEMRMKQVSRSRFVHVRLRVGAVGGCVVKLTKAGVAVVDFDARPGDRMIPDGEVTSERVACVLRDAGIGRSKRSGELPEGASADVSIVYLVELRLGRSCSQEKRAEGGKDAWGRLHDLGSPFIVGEDGSVLAVPMASRLPVRSSYVFKRSVTAVRLGPADASSFCEQTPGEPQGVASMKGRWAGPVDIAVVAGPARKFAQPAQQCETDEVDEQLEVKHFLVKGRVQGVGFRWFVHREAAEIGLRGWVKNTDEGHVEIVAAGDAEQLAELMTALRKGSRGSRVDAVLDHDLEAQEAEKLGQFVIEGAW